MAEEDRHGRIQAHPGGGGLSPAPDAQAPIGVFDSGIGGLSVLKALRSELPHERFAYFADTGHAPYGERSDDFVANRSLEIARELVSAHGVKALVVACNTATAAAVHLIRGAFPALPVVGIEPGLKPAAAASSTRRVGVLATRVTLSSAKFAALQDSLRNEATFVLQPCDGLADAIERGEAAAISALVQRHVGALGSLGMGPSDIDTLVLGCTHYPLVQEEFGRVAGPRVRIVETGAAVARQARALLGSAGLLGTGPCGLTLISSGDATLLETAAARWLR